MLRGLGPVVPVAVSLALTACGGVGSTTIDISAPNAATAATPGAASNGTTPSGFAAPAAPITTDNLLVATASTAAVVATVGGNRNVSITFASSNGQPMTGFELSNSAGSLPAGWSAPSPFACASVSSGSDCVLDLAYAPTAIDSGTITVNYVVIDAAGLPQTNGSLTLPYAATAHNHVIAAASPVGQVVADGMHPVAVTIDFTTDDGNPATNLQLGADLGSLPAGWTAAQSAFSCAIVSTGSGCELALNFAAGGGAGTLSLAYTYLDEAGAAQSGQLQIPYAIHAGDIVAGAAPSGQIAVAEKVGSQQVTVSFATDDGSTASQFYILSDLAHLPAGWSAAAQDFACAAVSTANACRLGLTYAPPALARGTLTLRYGYTDGSGAVRTGSYDIDYVATTNDNVVATVVPAGPVSTVVGRGPVVVTATFTTDDSRAATALSVATDLTLLPTGWTAASIPFSCPAIDADSTCALPLTYQPAAAGNGTLSLHYDYRNNAGEAKSGTLSLPYRATTDDIVAASAMPASLAVFTGTNNAVEVTFATDDGNPATGLALQAATLPPGWSTSTPALTCATVSAGTPCALALTYAPAAPDGGTLQVPFTYLNDAGISKNGVASITYSATTPPPPDP